MDKSKKSFVMNTLRRGSYRWYGRWQASKRSHLGHNQYYCEECGIIGKKKEFQLDHTIPVVLTSGWDGWDNVIDRLYCEPEGMKRLCIDCHTIKTRSENQSRPRLPKKPKNKSKKHTNK